MSRPPLLRGVSPPLRDEARLDMLHGAIEAIAQRRGLDPGLKARGIAPLASAVRRLEQKLHAEKRLHELHASKKRQADRRGRRA